MNIWLNIQSLYVSLLVIGLNWAVVECLCFIASKFRLLMWCRNSKQRTKLRLRMISVLIRKGRRIGQISIRNGKPVRTGSFSPRSILLVPESRSCLNSALWGDTTSRLRLPSRTEAMILRYNNCIVVGTFYKWPSHFQIKVYQFRSFIFLWIALIYGFCYRGTMKWWF